MGETNQDVAERRSLARGGALSFIGSATSAALGFALTIVISRLMGADGAGVVFQTTGVFAVIMAFAKCGMDSTSIYLLPRVLYDDPRDVRATLNACLVISLVVGLVLVGAVELLAPVLWGSDQQSLVWSVQAIVLFVPFGAAFLTLTASLRALGSVRDYVLVANIAVPALRPPLVAIAAVATGSAVVVSVSWAVPLAMMMLVAVYLVNGRLSGVEQGNPVAKIPPKRRWIEIGKFAVPRTIAAGLEQAIIWVDVLLIGWLATDYAAGIYGGAARFVQAGLLVDAALRVIVSPRFSALLHQAEKAKVRELYVTASSWLVLLGTPAYVLLGLFSPVFLSLLGPEFTEGATALSILAAGMTITFLAGNIHSMLIMSGRSGWAAFNKLVVLVVNVVGNIILIPRMGIEGAALVWSLSMVLDAVLALIQVRVFLGIAPRPGEVLAPLVIVLVAFGVPGSVALALLGNALFALFVAIIVGGGIFVAACWRWRVRLRLDGLVDLVRKR